MSLDWGNMPHLPLGCILDHLCTEDALAAMSTCRHWRSSMSTVYQGRKEILKLRVSELERAMFLSRLFKRNTRRLHITLDGSQDEVDHFINEVLTQFFVTRELRELMFIVPNCLLPKHLMPLIKLKRVIIESLFFKNVHCMETLALVGCQLDDAKDEDRHIHQHVERFSRGLVFTRMSFMSVIHTDISNLTANLKLIVLDYSQISTSCLLTLKPLRQLQYLTLNITNRRPNCHKINWGQVQKMFDSPLEVSLNIIALPYKKFEKVIDNILDEDTNLVSLKVMFCKYLYYSILIRVAQLYGQSMVEVVWVDLPNDSNDGNQRLVRPYRRIEQDGYAQVNPFVFLCWQCIRLRRLVIHGYWMWHYDLLGFVRLRKTLTQLEISAVYYNEARFQEIIKANRAAAIRVMTGDVPTKRIDSFTNEINLYTDFTWEPIPWTSLHPGLLSYASQHDRTNYVLDELRRSPADTLY